MKNNQNVIVAIALSFLVIVGWQFLIVGPKLEAERQRLAAQQAQQAATPAPATGAPAGGTAVPGAPTAPVATAPAAPVPGAAVAGAVSRDAALARSERVKIDTPSLKGSINLTGGRLDDLLLADYHLTVEPTSPLVEFFSPAGSAHPYFADFGWVSSQGGPAAPTAETKWRAEGGPLAPGKDVTLSWDNAAGLVFKRVFSVDEKYMFTVRQTVENKTSAPVELFPYGVVSRTGLPTTSGFFILHEGLIAYTAEERLEEVSYAGGGWFSSKRSLEEERSILLAKTESGSGWLGITDKYWGSALIPFDAKPFQARFQKGAAGAEPTYQADFLGDPVTVPAGATAESKTMLFAGAKEVRSLEHYMNDLSIPNFKLMIDWGWFYFITQPMFKLIDWFYHLLGNFGLAILAVTVVVKAAFFPLANRSYASMTKMKKLQPEMVKLQERFKDDRMALQQAMMQLYKQEKVNPVAGCWPVLIQIPVFFALYKVLFITIEMRHAPFFGWVRDLSAPDPTTMFNLFGLIPWTPPPVLHLGIWPLIMGFTMFVQMRMNPTPPDKTQAMIFNWMPVVFTFMLGSFPAGLVIYWAWNNTLSVLQQGVMMRRHGVPIELFGNLKGMFGRGKPKGSPAE